MKNKNIKEKYSSDRGFFSFKLKSKLIILLDKKDIQDYQSYDINRPENKYIVSVANVLKISNKYKFNLFLIEFEKIIRNQQLPVFKFNHVIRMYELWLKNPQFCNSILYLSSKLRNTIKLFDDRIWMIILKESINYKTHELYALFQIMYRFLKYINIEHKTDIDLIKQLFNTKFVKEELPTEIKTMEKYIDKKYQVLFTVIRYKRQEWTNTEYQYLYSKKFMLGNIIPNIPRNKEKVFKFFLKEILTQNLNYIFKYTILELLKISDIHEIRPELFENLNIHKYEKESLLIPSILSIYGDNSDVINWNTMGELCNHINYNNFTVSGVFMQKTLTMSKSERVWFYNSLKGESLRKQSIPFTLSRKGAHLFTNTMFAGSYNTITEAILIAEYTSKGVNSSFASVAVLLLTNNKQENDYYIHMFIMLSQKGLYARSVRETFDYMKAKSFYETYNNSFKNKKLVNIIKDVQWYHEELMFQHFYLNKRFLNQKITNATHKECYVINKERYDFVPLQNYKELFIEGKQMKHCVFEYREACAFRGEIIYSLRKVESNKTFRRLLTIEVDSKNRIIQAKGLYNRVPKPIEMKVLHLWAKENNFIFLSA